MLNAQIQTALHLVYPPRCLGCGSVVDSDFGLCPTCWAQTDFIRGAKCSVCAAPLPGSAVVNDAICDGCLQDPPPWKSGVAAVLYREKARGLVMGLKHGDRTEISVPAAGWMALACKDIPTRNILVVPIPLHWTRLLKRRYNQSALLAKALAEKMDMPYSLDLLKRVRRTPSLDKMSPDARHNVLTGSFDLTKKRAHLVAGGRPILLVDDVLTTGATLREAYRVLKDAGAGAIHVAVLARAAKPA